MNSGIYNQDCLIAMKQFPDNFFELAIVDPPYGIGESNADFNSRNTPIKQKNGTVLNAPDNDYKRKKWDLKPPSGQYFFELKRISSHQIIWGINHFPYKFTSGRIVWDKLNGNNDFSDCEIAFCSKHKSVRKFTYMWAGMMQGSYADGSRMEGNKKLNEKRIHPTQKPIRLYEWLLMNYADCGCGSECDCNIKILDTHLGSGSSAIAAHRLGFEFWGYEIDKDYFKAAQKRINLEKTKLNLFTNH